jgi:hypothetical protein
VLIEPGRFKINYDLGRIMFAMLLNSATGSVGGFPIFEKSGLFTAAPFADSRWAGRS